MKDAARKILQFSEHPGKRIFEENLRFIFQRDLQNKSLRKLGLTASERDVLKIEAESFLKLYEDKGLFEKDNFDHVHRLVSFAKKNQKELNLFFGIDFQDLELLALLHDLGKSLVCFEMHEFLSLYFTKDDFVNLRVIPHELYSMVWIQRLCQRVGISDSVANVLCDQIANHNLGPNLRLSENSFLKEKYTNGCYKHWWVERWNRFTNTLNSQGLSISTDYGYAESPLSNLLVLCDRIDGCSLDAWKKYLNQDWLSGELSFDSKIFIHLLEESYQNAKEQVCSIGVSLRKFVLEGNLLENFPPYKDSLLELEKSHAFLEALVRSNTEAYFKKFGLSHSNNILFQDARKKWRRAVKVNPSSYGIFLWEKDHWKKIGSLQNPVDAFFSLRESEGS